MDSLLPCLNNYTFFPSQFYNLSADQVYIMNATTPFDCKHLCNLDTNCYGFNYDGFHYQCYILLTNTFSPKMLLPVYSYGKGFYMQSYSYCDSALTPLGGSYILIICLSVMLMCMCCLCFSKKRNYQERITIRRNTSREALLENGVPPPYRRNVNSDSSLD